MRLEGVTSGEWAQFLSQAESTSPFHEVGWIRTVEAHSGLRAALLIGYRGAEPVVGIPMFVGRRAGFRLCFSPPPGYGIPFLGPVFKGVASLRESKRRRILREFFDALGEVGIRSPWAVCKIDMGSWVDDLRPFIDGGLQVIPRYTYVIDLAGGFASFLQTAQRAVRVAIRHSQGQLAFREGSPQDFDWVLDTIRARYRAQARASRIPSEYVRALLGNLPQDRLRCFLAEANGTRVTGVICIARGDTVYSWLGNPRSPAFPHANRALLGDIARWSVENGFARIDLLGANVPEIARFKARFNPTLETYTSAYSAPALLRAIWRFQGG